MPGADTMDATQARQSPVAGPGAKAPGPDADLAAFRDALATFPSGVTVVTTRDGDGRPMGFTATAFTSVSGSPPQVLVCLACAADCYAAFLAGPVFVVNVLAAGQHEVAVRFATKGVDKFAGLEVADGAHGVPMLGGAAAVLECRASERLQSGDHVILVGDVLSSRAHGHEPLVYFQRAFHRLAAKP
ncbi:MAG: flavin reductase ActVB [Solirubrobacteraceae bacterium]|jgi:flavin reductase ActVB|nr:flavin reductase ActVB [Solirubrobacteraceae bacterium]